MPDALARLNAALAGRYRVERKLGEGGMATVYAAEDLRHGRKVALKVLKPELAAALGADRFLLEIRTTAALQHPHVLPLFDSGEADGLLFYVMPLVEGESLRERLDRERQLPVDEAVRIATNVAEALAHAHRNGVVHRDVKPANILLVDGKPVVSDFGIALVPSQDSGRLTETGLSLGTPHYMSPEQATGERGVGPATDVWALGCVLFEMLVGEPPFPGRTPQAVLGRIMTSEVPSASGVRRTIPPHVDAAIRKSLERVPADRFRTADEFARALADASFHHGDRSASRSRRRIGSLLVAGFAGVAAVVVAGLFGPPADPVVTDRRAAARFDVTPADSQQLPLVPGVEFALSPDGRSFVFVGTAPSGASQLWRRSVESLEAEPIRGTENALHPSYSPDGRSVAYSGNGQVFATSLDGGPVVTLGDGAIPAWGTDGMIYFSSGGVIHRVPETGGASEPFTAPIEGNQQRFVSALPEGRGLVMTVGPPGPSPELSWIGVVGPEGGEVREILQGTMARYSPTGHLLYATAAGTVMAAPFDTRRLAVTGEPFAALESVVVKSGSASSFAISPSGTAMYAVDGAGLYELVWVDRAGRVEAVDSTWTADFSFPALSPDGRRVALSIRRPESLDIWVKELDAGPARRLTLDGTRNDMATWTPDGEAITLSSNRAGILLALWSKRADGSGRESLVLERDSGLAEPTWSPDGEWLAYGMDAVGSSNLLATRLDDGYTVIVAGSDGHERAPSFSPDGRFVAYTSNESGFYEVYVASFPDVASGKWVVSSGGGAEPVWSRDGRELFHRTMDGNMVAVPVSLTPTFSMGTRRILFSDRDYRAHLNHRQYDVTADGQRFLMLRAVSGEMAQWVMVLDFFSELRRPTR